MSTYVLANGIESRDIVTVPNSFQITHQAIVLSSRGALLRSSDLGLVGEGHTEAVEAKQCQSTQASWQRLLRLERARNTATRQYNTGKQRQLDAVGLAVLDAVTTKGVEGTH